MFSDDILPPFYSAYAKANWAANNIQDITNALTRYVDERIRVRVEQPNGADGETLVHIQSEPFPNVEVSLTVGDIVRNLRKSLDHAISGVFRDLIGKGSDARTKFPFGEDRKDMVGRSEGIFIDTRVDHVSDAIIYNIKPTRSENFPLWALNQVSNSNKHRVITTTFALVNTFLANYTLGSSLSHNNVRALEPGSEFSYPIPAGAKVTDNAHLKPALEVAFGPAEVFANLNVVPTLVNCTQAVFSALQELQKAYVLAAK